MNSIDKFIKAQEKDYELALNEIKSGKKSSHWIWYIFPQLSSLGFSSTAKYYGIKDLEEAKEYLENDILKSHLEEITNELLMLPSNDILSIVGFPDNLKINSSMTLFYLASNNELYKKVIDKYYNSKMDENTIKLLEVQK